MWGLSVAPPNSNVEVLLPGGMVLEVEHWEVIRFDEVMRVRPHDVVSVLTRRGKDESSINLSLSAM